MAGQRKPGEGTFTRLATGRVRYRVMRGYHPDGRRQVLNFYGDTEADCRSQFLDHQLEERQFGHATPADKRAATVAQFAVVFRERLDAEVDAGALAPGTADFYRGTLERHVLPALGRLRLRDVGAEQCERLYARFADRPRTAQAVHQTLHRLLTLAKRYRYTTTVATQDAEKPTYKAPERTPPGGAALKLLLDAAEAASPRMAAVLALACTGLRPGEVMGIDRPALRLEEGVVEVLVARDTRGAPDVKPVKSAKGRRRVPLTRRTVALLRAYLEAEPVRRMSGPLFCTRDGKALHWRNVYRDWVPIRDAAGLPRTCRPYDLRHAFITELLAEGIPLHEVSWLAGHASSSFTADTYGHRVPRRDPAARSALERAMGEEH